MKPITTDIFSFESLIRGGSFYVDKTDYVWKLVNSNTRSYFLSRPRRFGKSLLLNTLKAYFQGKRNLFAGLMIESLAAKTLTELETASPDSELAKNWTDGRPWEEFPVVRLDMAQASSPESIEAAMRKMRRVLRDAAEECGLTVEEKHPADMIAEIIHTLHAKTGKKVVILIDEYDKPILDALNKPFIESAVGLCKEFYQELKSANDKIRFLFITGVTKFAHTSLFSGANNPTDISLDFGYATMLGYPQEEMEREFADAIGEACAATGMTRERLLHLVKVWYNGFRFAPGAETVYNPASVGKFFMQGYVFRNYWWETGTPTFLVDLVRERGMSLDAQIDVWRGADDTQKSEYTMLDPLSLAVQTGYLTIARWRIDEDDGSQQCAFDFPNTEVRNSWNKQMLAIARGVLPPDVNAQIIRLRDLLNEANVNAFMENLDWFFAGTPYENAGEITEGYFRNQLRMIFVMFGLPNTVEVQVARGRVDIVAQTRKTALVFEVKMQTNKKQKSRLIAAALKQGREKHYADKYKAESEIVKLVAVVFDKETRRVTGWKAEEA